MTDWFVVVERSRKPSRSKNAVNGNWPWVEHGGPYLKREDAEARIRSLRRSSSWRKADLQVMRLSDD